MAHLVIVEQDGETVDAEYYCSDTCAKTSRHYAGWNGCVEVEGGVCDACGEVLEGFVFDDLADVLVLNVAEVFADAMRHYVRQPAVLQAPEVEHHVVDVEATLQAIADAWVAWASQRYQKLYGRPLNLILMLTVGDGLTGLQERTLEQLRRAGASVVEATEAKQAVDVPSPFMALWRRAGLGEWPGWMGIAYHLRYRIAERSVRRFLNLK
jgi:hypothetical protein